MTVTPVPVMAALVEVIVCRIKRRRPKLFANLARLDPATVLIEPADLPCRFVLKLGCHEPTLELELVEIQKQAYDACVSAPLEKLLDMLEARSDGDTLFFERGIAVTGNTAVIVALRNTLDREEINLLDDILSFCGPLAKPATAALFAIDRLAHQMRKYRTNEI